MLTRRTRRRVINHVVDDINGASDSLVAGCDWRCRWRAYPSSAGCGSGGLAHPIALRTENSGIGREHTLAALSYSSGESGWRWPELRRRSVEAEALISGTSRSELGRQPDQESVSRQV